MTIDRIPAEVADPEIAQLRAGHAKLMKMQRAAEEALARVNAIVARVNEVAAAVCERGAGGVNR